MVFGREAISGEIVNVYGLFLGPRVNVFTVGLHKAFVARYMGELESGV